VPSSTPTGTPHNHRTSRSCTKHDEPVPYHLRATMRPAAVPIRQHCQRTAYTDVSSRLLPTRQPSGAHTNSNQEVIGEESASARLRPCICGATFENVARCPTTFLWSYRSHTSRWRLLVSSHSVIILRRDAEYIVTCPPHCYSQEMRYVQQQCCSGSLKQGQSPTSSEESGEVSPRRESSFCQVSESDLGGRSQQTSSEPLGKTFGRSDSRKALACLLRGTHGHSNDIVAGPFVADLDPRARIQRARDTQVYPCGQCETWQELCWTIACCLRVPSASLFFLSVLSVLFSGEAKAETVHVSKRARILSKARRRSVTAPSFIAKRRLFSDFKSCRSREARSFRRRPPSERRKANTRPVMKQVSASLRARIGRCSQASEYRQCLWGMFVQTCGIWGISHPVTPLVLSARCKWVWAIDVLLTTDVPTYLVQSSAGRSARRRGMDV